MTIGLLLMTTSPIVANEALDLPHAEERRRKALQYAGKYCLPEIFAGWAAIAFIFTVAAIGWSAGTTSTRVIVGVILLLVVGTTTCCWSGHPEDGDGAVALA